MWFRGGAWWLAAFFCLLALTSIWRGANCGSTCLIESRESLRYLRLCVQIASSARFFWEIEIEIESGVSRREVTTLSDYFITRVMLSSSRVFSVFCPHWMSCASHLTFELASNCSTIMMTAIYCCIPVIGICWSGFGYTVTMSVILNLNFLVLHFLESWSWFHVAAFFCLELNFCNKQLKTGHRLFFSFFCVLQKFKYSAEACFSDSQSFLWRFEVCQLMICW